MANPKRARALRAAENSSAAKWRRRAADDRSDRTILPTLGGFENCWCGLPVLHGWPGKDDGAPHPRDTPEDSTMVVIINPGSGPVPDATEEHASANMAAFADDLRARGLGVDTFTRRAQDDYGQGRYAFTLTMSDERTIEIQMPGLAAERVRYVDSEQQDIWDFPRLYVDGSSWVWKFALGVCEPDDEEND